ncbi:MAG: phosphorylase [Gloeocapsa sp. DLM2.Bin57]|nr:MAG: phosphorylase [Gloeocapsa sp. DLM2.Bin57]
MFKQIEAILVTKGAEYAAVCHGLQKTRAKVKVIPIPMGVSGLRNYLQTARLTQQRVLLLGLAGSLNPKYRLGNIVIYQSCCYQTPSGELLERECQQIPKRLSGSLVKGLTCDRLVHTSLAKTELSLHTGADVVDMESWLIRETFPEVAIVRVISDNYEQNLPDLNLALDSQGNLNPFSLALRMSQKPIASGRLIISSLKALKVLQTTTTALFLE